MSLYGQFVRTYVGTYMIPHSGNSCKLSLQTVQEHWTPAVATIVRLWATVEDWEMFVKASPVSLKASASSLCNNIAILNSKEKQTTTYAIVHKAFVCLSTVAKGAANATHKQVSCKGEGALANSSVLQVRICKCRFLKAVYANPANSCNLWCLRLLSSIFRFCDSLRDVLKCSELACLFIHERLNCVTKEQSVSAAKWLVVVVASCPH